MTPHSVRPQPCLDPDCREQHPPAERIALATSLCSARGVKLTKLRRNILELLWEFDSPTGAYELIKALEAGGGRRVGPPTVYRALGFLISQGLVSKIESRNAYRPCNHPERQHDSVFFLCSNCGASTELENPKIEKLISQEAALIGFQPSHRVVEVEGICANCSPVGGS
jgi:Fur family zinc uptake transcriptional regulator